MHSVSDVSILFVSHKYPPSTGGMEKQSFELITRMHQYAKVHQLVHDGSESIIRFFRRLNCRIINVLHRHPEIRVIHFNDGLIASLALYHRGYDHLKKVVTVHGLDVVFPFSFFQRRIIPRFNHFDQIIAVSQATAQAIINRGVHQHRVQVVSNGIDHHWSAENNTQKITALLAKHHIPSGKRYLVLLGRPVKRKGFSWFIRHVLPQLDQKYHVLVIGPFAAKATWKERVLNTLPAKWRHLIMLFLGYPSDQQALRKLLQNPRYATRATHLGKIPSSDLQIVLSEATAFVMPNIFVAGDMEGFGLVCLEASSSGAIVFAASIEGITDAVQHQKNGFLVTPEHVPSWLQSLSFLDHNSDDIYALRKQFRDYTLANFSWDKMAEAYFQIFHSLLAQEPQKNS
ncbi:glycosyltransferase family 4 protein [Sphingobacterium sp. lm-10]|uniref:glycosyltransferase family 4 protein n=1 Tax=Sphingobacterium sp. lm-10 TaxID=2944904 RepID=UPI0020228759|nr:glycosyltransferase family 4 protein [Sphingobacterium sp. lm-10]MCL7989114.1 glycosyltransferase family 4 protein [Sphingobacterium sp. lm-10]